VVAEPRWLTAEERRDWVAFLRATRLLFSQLERDVQQGAGMPLTDYEVLSTLSETPGRALRLGTMAEMLQVSPSRLSHAVDRLQKAGWVRREPCPSDRRGWVAVLTDEGFAVLQAAAPIHVESVRRRLLDRLSPEQMQQLGSIGETLLARQKPES
jgi:DNA-binding MarR family transcriptional regulator